MQSYRPPTGPPAPRPHFGPPVGGLGPPRPSLGPPGGPPRPPGGSIGPPVGPPGIGSGASTLGPPGMGPGSGTLGPSGTGPGVNRLPGVPPGKPVLGPPRPAPGPMPPPRPPLVNGHAATNGVSGPSPSPVLQAQNGPPVPPGPSQLMNGAPSSSSQTQPPAPSPSPSLAHPPLPSGPGPNFAKRYPTPPSASPAPAPNMGPNPPLNGGQAVTPVNSGAFVSPVNGGPIVTMNGPHAPPGNSAPMAPVSSFPMAAPVNNSAPMFTPVNNSVTMAPPPVNTSAMPPTSQPATPFYGGGPPVPSPRPPLYPGMSHAQQPPPTYPPSNVQGQGPPSLGAGRPPGPHIQGPPPLGPHLQGPPMGNAGLAPPPSSTAGLAPPPVGNPGQVLPPPSTPGSLPPHTFKPQTDSRFGQTANTNSLSNQLGGLSITQTGFQKMWGQESVDLLQNRHILPPEEVTPPKPKLQAEQWNQVNCSPDIFRCTLTKIPETEALLKKARLPLGVLIHPFKDLSHLPVIQCSTIVRCRSCRTYINPFVHFVDQRRWRCNLCYRVNELPEEFLYDPVSKSYGDPSRRPECKSATIEFIAPQEYMLRPPQPAVYLFLLDTSRQALETGYLRNFCDTLVDELEKLPGDSRTQVGFITFNRTLQFYQIAEGSSQATQLVVGDLEDVFLPSPSDLLINLANCKEQLSNMLSELPELFNGCQETENCLGAALQAAYKMVYQTGGRITVVQASLPSLGPGQVRSREGGGGGGLDAALLNPTTDFYKKLALDCSGQQIAVDLFCLHNTHTDLATVSGIAKFSGGQVQTFPGYHSHHNPPVAESFERALRRYLTRKVGFEAVMRIRCTRGMTLHTFHGHFFVRSTDLLSLPNVNPDTAFGMQVAIEEDLKDSREVSFQAALLYTSSKGERRIRVHTLCIPVSNSLQEIIQGADQHCIVGLLAKMAVDRSLNSSLTDAREAFINVCVDTIERWKMIQCISQPGALPVSSSLRLVPLLILALLKSEAFTLRQGVKLDTRTAALINMKCLPLTQLIQTLYPDMYRVDGLETAPTIEDEEGSLLPNPPRLQLSAEKLVMNGAFLLDLGHSLILFIGKVCQPFFCERIFGVSQPSSIDENLTDLPELDNEDSERLRLFIQSLNNRKSHSLPVRVIRDDSKSRQAFISMLIDDRSEGSYSYYEFLQHLKSQMK